MNYKQEIAKLIDNPLITAEDITPIADNRMGDFALPCFKPAKEMRKNPMAVAEELAGKVNASIGGNVIFLSKVEAVSGYLNFFINPAFYFKNTLDALQKKSKDVSGIGKGKTVCIDYSSINIAKPLHIGHLMTTVIGGSLYRIYKRLGYKVVGINHLGDYGTQFGKLISAFLKWGDESELRKNGIRSLVDLYVRFHNEAERNHALNDEARAWFVKIEKGEEEANRIYKLFKDVTLAEISKTYKLLGVEFDSYDGESFFSDKMAPVVEELEAKGLLISSEGAKVVDLKAYGMPPCLILKKDGSSLYATRDLAAALYRKQTYDFDKCLYVVAYQQNLHFKQVFKVLELMGREYNVVHVPFGMVSLKDVGKLTTRGGNVVYLSDVLNAAIKKAGGIIKEKNPGLERTSVPEEVGVGAVIFYALATSRIKDVIYSEEAALSFEGETGPYAQYTHARCCSVIRKGIGHREQEIDYTAVADEEALTVIRLLDIYHETIITAAEKYEPSILAKYLIDLAQAYNKFYFERKIIGEDSGKSAGRLALTQAVRDVLKEGLDLLLIKTPEKM